MFVKFNGRYAGPFLEGDSTGNSGGANNQENSQQNGEVISKAEHEKAVAALEAKHAKEYSGLQTTLNKKDESLKATVAELEERTSQYSALTGTHTEVSSTLETVQKTALEKENENKRLKLENARSKLILKEFPHLAGFEYPEGEGQISLIPQIEPWKEDGSLDEEKLRSHFTNFSKALGDRGQIQKKVEKQGETPPEPVPQQKVLSNSQALLVKAQEYLNSRNFPEYNKAMSAYYEALKAEGKK